MDIQRSPLDGEDVQSHHDHDYESSSKIQLCGRIPRRAAKRHLPWQSLSCANHIVVVSSSSKSSSDSSNSSSSWLLDDSKLPPPSKRPGLEPATTSRTTTSAHVQEEHQARQVVIQKENSFATTAPVTTPAASTRTTPVTPTPERRSCRSTRGVNRRFSSNKNETSSLSSHSTRGKQSSRSSNKTARKRTDTEEQSDHQTSNTPLAGAMQQFDRSQDEDACFLWHFRSPQPPPPETKPKVRKKAAKKETTKRAATAQTVETPLLPKKLKKQLLEQEDFEYEVDPKPILIPRQTDVLFGRGSFVSKFPGNAKYREFCRGLRDDYLSAYRMEKQRVARLVVHLVQGQNPPGRFLVQEGDVYRQAEEEKVMEKISQALREQKWLR